MSEPTKMRKLLESINESSMKTNTWLQVKDEHINDIADFFIMDESTRPMWINKIKGDNTFFVLGQEGDEVYVDYNGDEFEAPVAWFEPADGEPQTYDDDENRMSGGGFR